MPLGILEIRRQNRFDVKRRGKALGVHVLEVPHRQRDAPVGVGQLHTYHCFRTPHPAQATLQRLLTNFRNRHILSALQLI